MLRRLFAALLFAVAVSAATPAHASTLTITSFECDETSGGSTFWCSTTVSGGRIGFMYTWSPHTVNTRPPSTTTTTSYHQFSCSIGGPEVYVYVTVTDSSGASAVSQMEVVQCP